jgi:hypothetical protein
MKFLNPNNMTPQTFEEQNVVFGKDQEGVQPLPGHIDKLGTLVTRWSFSDEEKVKIAETGEIWLSQHTFNNPLQPILPSVTKPLIEE